MTLFSRRACPGVQAGDSGSGRRETGTESARQKAWELVNEFVTFCEPRLTDEQCKHASMLVDAIADALTEARKPDWKPISDAAKDRPLLVANCKVSDGFMQVAEWDEDHKEPYKWSTSDGPTFHRDAFTHCMELPPPPIE